MGSLWSTAGTPTEKSGKSNTDKSSSAPHKCNVGQAKAHISDIVRNWERHIFQSNSNSNLFIPIPLIHIIQDYSYNRVEELLKKDPTYFDCVIKILLIGQYGVGKSCLSLRYSEKEPYARRDYGGTAVHFRIKRVEVNNLFIKIQMWDPPGEERHGSIRSAYYRGVHLFFCVYDITC